MSKDDFFSLCLDPPLKPPPPASPSVKLGGTGDRPSTRADRDRVIAHIAAVAAQPLPEPRPPFADEIDRMVAAFVRSGDVKLDRATGEYRGTGWRCFRFGE